MAATAFGDGPKTLSFAPIRATKRRPMARSWVSGPTKGTVAGRLAASGVRRMTPSFERFSRYPQGAAPRPSPWRKYAPPPRTREGRRPAAGWAGGSAPAAARAGQRSAPQPPHTAGAQRSPAT